MSLGDQAENKLSKAERSRHMKSTPERPWKQIDFLCGWAQLALIIAKLFPSTPSISFIQQVPCSSFAPAGGSGWTDLSRWVQIPVLWLGLFSSYYLFWQGFSEATKGIPSRPRLWMQAFPCSGNQIAFLPELSAELRNREDVAAGMFLDPFCCQQWVRLCLGLHVCDLEEEGGIMSKQPRAVCAGSGSVHIQPDR